MSISVDLNQEYNIDSLLPYASVCCNCGKSTIYRCSRCHTAFYCSRTCQRLLWPAHKVTCTLTQAPSPMLRNSPDVESRPFGFIHERNNEGDAPTSSPVTVDATDDFKFNFEMTSQPQDFSSSKSLKSSYSSPRMLFSVPEGTQEDESGDRCSPQCVPCNDISEMTPDPIKELEARNDRILKENVQLLCTSLGVTEDDARGALAWFGENVDAAADWLLSGLGTTPPSPPPPPPPSSSRGKPFSDNKINGSNMSGNSNSTVTSDYSSTSSSWINKLNTTSENDLELSLVGKDIEISENPVVNLNHLESSMSSISETPMTFHSIAAPEISSADTTPIKTHISSTVYTPSSSSAKGRIHRSVGDEDSPQDMQRSILTSSNLPAPVDISHILTEQELSRARQRQAAVVGGIRLASKTKRSSLPSTSSPLVANFTDIPNIQNQVELDRSIPTTSNPSQNKAIPLSPLIHPERDDTIERLAANSGQGHWAVGTSPPSVSSEDDEENIAMLMSVCESNRESARKALWKCCGDVDRAAEYLLMEEHGFDDLD